MSSLLFRPHTAKNVPKLFYRPVRSVIKNFWPEPVTQQTLSEFLEDINYFERPQKYVNIGLDPDAYKTKNLTEKSTHELCQREPIKEQPDSARSTLIPEENIDALMNKLSVELKPQPLNYDHVRLSGKELTALAVYSGIYRDLFSHYEPDREYIKFTPDQAKRLSRLVPHYWITDQPNARVEHFPKKPEPTKYFESLIDVSARFVSKSNPDSDKVELVGNPVFYGNIIAACDALERPSITLDGKLLNPELLSPKLESEYDNWSSGRVELVNFPKDQLHYHTLILLNLDSLHENSSNLHWMLANIRPSSNNNDVIYDEVCDYLPVFGIRGFGYSRYVFLVLQHEEPLDVESIRVKDYTLDSRKFDTLRFLDTNQAARLRPVGLSWFQTTWDPSSNSIFHNQLNMKAPTFEHVQAKYERLDNPLYAGRRPFNVFLDNCRTKKSINEQVLLERLKNVDPFDYKDQYVPPKVPETVFSEPHQPSWMKVVNMKKKNRLGYWRGLRPASALLPLDNNADLDTPLRPLESANKKPAEFPNEYRKFPRYQLIKDMPTSLPPNEHQANFIQEDHEIHLDKVIEIMEEYKKSKKTD